MELDMELVFGILGLMAAAIIPALVALKKGYNPLVFWLFGLVFILPALVVAFLLPPRAHWSVYGGGASSSELIALLRKRGPLTVAGIADASGYPEGTVEKALLSLKDEYAVSMERGGRWRALG